MKMLEVKITMALIFLTLSSVASANRMPMNHKDWIHYVYKWKEKQKPQKSLITHKSRHSYKDGNILIDFSIQEESNVKKGIENEK